MGKVRIRGAAPAETYNGLAAISERLVERDEDVIYAVVKIGVYETIRRVHRNEDEHEGPELIPVVEILAIEPILDELGRPRVVQAYRDAYFARTGAQDTLPEAVVEMPQGHRDAHRNGTQAWDGHRSAPTPEQPAATSNLGWMTDEQRAAYDNAIAQGMTPVEAWDVAARLEATSPAPPAPSSGIPAPTFAGPHPVPPLGDDE
jgi:hypothetical protein